MSTSLAAQPRTLVKAVRVEPAMRDIVIRYSGKIEPWETYSLGFEIGGRVAALGKNDRGGELDDGDRVQAGQELARLDDRVLRARYAEATANFELASSDLQRSRRVREVSPSAITEAEYQDDVTRRAQSAAAQQVAEKNLEDSVLTSPVTGTIAERMIEAGESVNPHETVFEIVENDRLRLIVNVPEARVRELELRRRAVQQAKSTSVAIRRNRSSARTFTSRGATSTASRGRPSKPRSTASRRPPTARPGSSRSRSSSTTATGCSAPAWSRPPTS